MADPAVEISCKPYIKCYIYNWRVVHQCCTHTWNKNPFFLLQHAVSFLPLRLGAQWHVKHTHRCTLVCRQWLPYSHPWSSVNVSTILLCLHWLNWGFAVCFLFCCFYFCMCVFVFRENSVKCNVSGIREFLAPGKWVITAGNKCKSRKNLRDNVISN